MVWFIFTTGQEINPNKPARELESQTCTVTAVPCQKPARKQGDSRGGQLSRALFFIYHEGLRV
jgi:hypothetical protein